MKTLKKKMMRKSVLPTLLALVLSMVIVLTGTGSSTQTSSTTTVYLDPPTINGTAIGVGNTIMVNINIRGAPNVSMWGAGLTFNPDVLECTSFKEGTFLKNVGPTLWSAGTIDNAAGVITGYACTFQGVYKASDDGQLAYLTFKVKATGISDLHPRDVGVEEMVWDPILKIYVLKAVPFNIIDVYTVIVDTTSHTVVTVSNSTRKTGTYGSGFYDHAFSAPDKEISFKVTGPYASFSNVTIPKTLLSVDGALGNWTVIINGIPLATEERTVTYNGTHYSIYFTYTAGIHNVQITIEPRSPSTISINLSKTNITLGESVTISGKITPLEPGYTIPIVNATIKFRLSGAAEWNTLATVATDLNGNYSYLWMPNKTSPPPYEVKAIWEGWEYPKKVLGAESGISTLTVRGISPEIYPPFEVVVEGEVFHVVVYSNFTVSNLVFNQTLKEITFNVAGPVTGDNTYVCNVTIPKELLWCEDPKDWVVQMDGAPIVPAITENETHTSMYFIRSASIHTVRITTRISTISIALSLTTIKLRENVTISGTIVPLRIGANVTILYRLNGGNWTLVATNRTTNEYGNYSYVWKPGTVGTYELKASWDGDPYTNAAESDPLTLTVEEAPSIPLEIVIVVVVVIIIIAAIAVYFVKFRKPR